MRTTIRIAKLQFSKKQMLGGKIMLGKIFSKLFGVKSEEKEVLEERKTTEVTQEHQVAEDTVETTGAAFQKITAKVIATENGIDYISSVTEKKYNSGEQYANQFYAENGCYTLQMMEYQRALLSGMESLMEKRRC